MSDEVGKYQLTVTGYSGDAGNALMITDTEYNLTANAEMFSTPDSDNDRWPDGSCAAYESCGWWLPRLARCSASEVNKDSDGVWTTGDAVWDKVWDVQASHMLVKLN